MDNRKKQIIIESLREGLDFGEVPGATRTDIDDVLFKEMEVEDSKSLIDSWYIAFSSRMRQDLRLAEKPHEVAAIKASIDSAETAAKMYGDKLNQSSKKKASGSVTMSFIKTVRNEQ
jgi:hypothetical protein